MKTITIKDAISCNDCIHREVCKFRDQLTKESLRLLDFLEVKCKHYEAPSYVSWSGNGIPTYPTITPVETPILWGNSNTTITTAHEPSSDSNIQLNK